MRKSLATAVGATSLAFSMGLAAQPQTGAEIAAIRTEIAALMARLERLEQSSASAAPPAVPAAAPAAPAAAEARVAAAVPPAVRFSGDLRYRHETINEAGEIERNRQRLRARFGVTADIAQNVRVGL